MNAGRYARAAIFERIACLLFQWPRILKYRILSSCQNVHGSPRLSQPAILSGEGAISFGKNVCIGVYNSPGFFTGVSYIEARTHFSEIQFGRDVWSNNDLVIISEGPGVYIGDGVLIGAGVHIYDSDFHALAVQERRKGRPAMGAVRIGRNVFIGDRVIILKGVNVGDDSVIAAGAVVTRDVPSSSIVAGVPAKFVKQIPSIL